MKKKLHFLFLLFLIISVFLNCSCTKKAEISSFTTYTNDLFLSEIKSNTLNMHYTISDPEKFGISDYPVTLGHLSSEDVLLTDSCLENISNKLFTFDYDSLNTREKLSYDLLSDYINAGMLSPSYSLYYEPLSPGSGIQSELPILLAEYSFRREQDISDYLILLSQIPDYFEDIFQYEKEKSLAGLFMSDHVLDEVSSQCLAIANTDDSHFLVTTFNTRIDNFDGLNQDLKSDYKRKNKELLEKVVLPAYSVLSSQLNELRGTGKNEKGLCFYPSGRTYYQYLVRQNTGSKDTVEELMKRVSDKRLSLLNNIQSLLEQNPELSSEFQSCSVTVNEPEQILECLKSAMKSDFPDPPKTNLYIKYVDPAMEDFLAPAFYLTAPMDDTTNNSIYINNIHSYDNLRLFTTLAHEGYPGHLYQNLMSSYYDTSPLNEIFAYPGYTEGWATYVELRSYDYAGLNESLASLSKMNQSATLSLYASLDMGIHYDGWAKEDAASFLSSYGISSKDTSDEIYDYIVANPANYLKYYIGYLEFESLRDYAITSFGSDFHDICFHEAILKMGPAPFDLLEKYLPLYYELN